MNAGTWPRDEGQWGKVFLPGELKADSTGSSELSLALQKTELNSPSPITLWYLLFSSAWSARLLSNQRAQKMLLQCAKVCSSPREPKGDGHASVYHSVHPCSIAFIMVAHARSPSPA